MRELAQLLRAPVVPTQMALGVVATDSPHFIGHGGLIGGDAVREAFAQADVILAVGCRFSSWMWDERGPLARRHHRLININIDPAALGAPALHEVALQADAEPRARRPAGRAGRCRRLGRGRRLAAAAAAAARATTSTSSQQMAADAIAGDAPRRAGARHRRGAAARCARGLRRRPHHVLEQRPHAGCTTCARASTIPA